MNYPLRLRLSNKLSKPVQGITATCSTGPEVPVLIRLLRQEMLLHNIHEKTTVLNRSEQNEG